MDTAYISHPVCLLHEIAAHHPECPQRITAIEDQLKTSGLMQELKSYDAPKASREQLERAHDTSFVSKIINQSPKSGFYQIDPDTAMNPHTLEAALRAAGAGVLAIDLVMKGEVKRAFCNVRPPGHHAEHDKAMGFCFFNNIAVAAMHALEKHQLKRIAIVDFDVHHGNGTEDIVSQLKAQEAQVLFCSTYQHPYYPGFAGDSIKSKIVNVPLPAGTSSNLFQTAVKSQWLPELREFKPEIILISAGFDGHAEDSMGGFNLIDADYVLVTQEICKIADEFAQGRVISMLEGGYDLVSLGRATTEHVMVLMDD